MYQVTFQLEADDVQSVMCRMWVVDSNVKLVISDIDGTVTREDVMGHICYAFRGYFVHKDIVRAYQKIHVGALPRSHSEQRISDHVPHRSGGRSDEPNSKVHR